ncbi:MAG: hypothetical protein L0Y72_31700 [Gemmataceae bacterium]|nr:hypothetical protein [Gemmataceae bacterium]MCI0743618.1 hypothetical protein [Gemmataceae bacterium]
MNERRCTLCGELFEIGEAISTAAICRACESKSITAANSASGELIESADQTSKSKGRSSWLDPESASTTNAPFILRVVPGFSKWTFAGGAVLCVLLNVLAMEDPDRLPEDLLMAPIWGIAFTIIALLVLELWRALREKPAEDARVSWRFWACLVAGVLTFAVVVGTGLSNVVSQPRHDAIEFLRSALAGLIVGVLAGVMVAIFAFVVLFGVATGIGLFLKAVEVAAPEKSPSQDPKDPPKTVYEIFDQK